LSDDCKQGHTTQLQSWPMAVNHVVVLLALTWSDKATRVFALHEGHKQRNTFLWLDAVGRETALYLECQTRSF